MVLWWESIRLAFRELARHSGRSLLTSLGVVIGVAAVIATVSLVQGANAQIQGQISRLGTNMIIVRAGATSKGGVRAGAGSASTLTVDDSKALATDCPAVHRTAAIQRDVAQAVSPIANWQVGITGSTEDYLTIRDWNVLVGRGLTAADVRTTNKVCLLGLTTARELFGRRQPVGETIRIKGVPLRVIGLLEAKGQNPLGQDEDDTVLVPLTTLQRRLVGREHVVAVVASARSEQHVDAAVFEMRELLRRRHHLGPLEADDFAVDSLKQASETARQTGRAMTILAFIAAGISLLVGGIGIMNIMLVAVSERTREIGIRLAIGATRKAITLQFLIETMTLTGAGGLLGIILGIAFGHLLAGLTGWPTRISHELIVLSFAFSVSVGIVFGLLPARRAARLNPVESLRHD